MSHLALAAYYVYQSLSLFWLFPRPVNALSLFASFGMPLLVYVPMVRYLRPSRPEVITLGEDHLRHDLGRPAGYLAASDDSRQHGVDNRPLWRWLLGLPLLVEISKDELGEIVVERDDSRGRAGNLHLRYDAGADRIEIGRYLREPEKEWLAELIKEWQGPERDEQA